MASSVAAWPGAQGSCSANVAASGAHDRRRQPSGGGLRVCSYNSKALLISPETTVAERLIRSHRPDEPDRWAQQDDARQAAFKPLTREEAEGLRARDPSLSPWRVILVQAGVGGVAALLAVLFSGRQEWAWSVLYGAATVVVPGALMARGMTSRISSMSPGASAVSFMFWEMTKIGVSVAMLVLAPRLVQQLSWPALLVGLVLCMKVYWLALLWRGRKKNH